MADETPNNDASVTRNQESQPDQDIEPLEGAGTPDSEKQTKRDIFNDYLYVTLPSRQTHSD